MRVQIADQPRLCCPVGSWEVLGVADGVQNVFRLRFSKAILSSVVIGEQMVPSSPNAQLPTWQTVSPSNGSPDFRVPAYTVGSDASGLPIVTFASAPIVGTVLGTQYLVTAFLDSELQQYMGPENTLDTPTRTLQAIHYAIIPVILSNREASMVYRINDRTDDPSTFTRNLLAIRAQLKADLQQEPDDEPFGMTPSSYHPFSSYLR